MVDAMKKDNFLVKGWLTGEKAILYILSAGELPFAWSFEGLKQILSVAGQVISVLAHKLPGRHKEWHMQHIIHQSCNTHFINNPCIITVDTGNDTTLGMTHATHHLSIMQHIGHQQPMYTMHHQSEAPSKFCSYLQVYRDQVKKCQF